jgi:hypothetical protein
VIAVGAGITSAAALSAVFGSGGYAPRSVFPTSQAARFTEESMVAALPFALPR